MRFVAPFALLVSLSACAAPEAPELHPEPTAETVIPLAPIIVEVAKDAPSPK